MYNPLTLKTINRIIEAQTSVPPMTMEQEIAFLTEQIDRLHSEGAHDVATRKEIEREELKARYFVSLMPDVCDAIETFDNETQVMRFQVFSLSELFDALASVNEVYPEALRAPRRDEFLGRIKNEAASTAIGDG